MRMISAWHGHRLLRSSKYLAILCVALCLYLCLPDVSEGQDNSLASHIVRVLEAYQPSWKHSSGIESGRVPLVPNEKTILVATWLSPNRSEIKESVDVHIYEVENPGEGVEWLRPVRNNQVPQAWQTSVYDIGDEVYLASYRDGKRFEILFRKGHIVGKIAGNDLARVRAFAKYIVEQVSAN